MPIDPYKAASVPSVPTSNLEPDLAPNFGDEEPGYVENEPDVPAIPQRNGASAPNIDPAARLNASLPQQGRKRVDGVDLDLSNIRWYVTRQNKKEWQMEVWGDKSREQIIAEVWKKVGKEKFWAENEDAEESFCATQMAAVAGSKGAKLKFKPTDTSLTFQLPTDLQENESEMEPDQPFAPLQPLEPQAPFQPQQPLRAPNDIMGIMGMMMQMQQQAANAAEARAAASQQQFNQLIQTMMLNQNKSSGFEPDKVAAWIAVAKELGVVGNKAESPLGVFKEAMAEGMKLKSQAGLPNILELAALGGGAVATFLAASSGKDEKKPDAATTDAALPKIDPPKALPNAEAPKLPPPPADAPKKSVAQTEREALWGALTDAFGKQDDPETQKPANWASGALEQFKYRTIESLAQGKPVEFIAEWQAVAKAKNVAVTTEYMQRMVTSIQRALNGVEEKPAPPPAAPKTDDVGSNGSAVEPTHAPAAT